MNSALSDLTPAQQKVFDEWQEARKAYVEIDRLWSEADKALEKARWNCRTENIPSECFVAVYQGES
jgi:hypothetical protein